MRHLQQHRQDAPTAAGLHPRERDQYGGAVDVGAYSGTMEHCIDVDWPAAYTWSARQYRRGYSGPDAWMGSLIFESRDASGLYYAIVGLTTREEVVHVLSGIRAALLQGTFKR